MAGQRRIDVDELATIAQVFAVTSAELLAPSGTATPDHAAARTARDLATRIGQLLAASVDPADRETLTRNVDRAMRRLALEVEELLEEARGPDPRKVVRERV